MIINSDGIAWYPEMILLEFSGFCEFRGSEWAIKQVLFGKHVDSSEDLKKSAVATNTPQNICQPARLETKTLYLP